MKIKPAGYSDEDGNKLFCKCGNLASIIISGESALTGWCSECNPYSKDRESTLRWLSEGNSDYKEHSGGLVYRIPKDIPDIDILKDAWRERIQMRHEEESKKVEVTYKFTLPDNQVDLYLVQNAYAMRCVLDDINDHLRFIEEDTEAPPEVDKLCKEIREMIWAAIDLNVGEWILKEEHD